MNTLLTTGDHWAGLLLRLTVGLIMLPHGAQKVFGWFGGYGFSATMQYMTVDKHLPWIVGLTVIIIEFAGALMLIAGFGTRLWATALLFTMIGIILSSHIPNGFFMNWDGQQPGEGYEYHLLVIGICLTLIVIGGGRYSVDRMLFQ